VIIETLKVLVEATRVIIEGARVLVDSEKVIIEAARLLVKAVSVFVEAVRVITVTMHEGACRVANSSHRGHDRDYKRT